MCARVWAWLRRRRYQGRHRPRGSRRLYFEQYMRDTDEAGGGHDGANRKGDRYMQLIQSPGDYRKTYDYVKVHNSHSAFVYCRWLVQEGVAREALRVVR